MSKNTNEPVVNVLTFKNDISIIINMASDAYAIRIEDGANPDRYECRVAAVLANHFKSDIILRKNSQSYSPDLLVVRLNQLWEMKNIRGNGVHTIEHNLSKAKLQSDKVIVSLYRTKMTPKRAVGRIKAELTKNHEIKRLILITKDGKAVEIK